MTIEFSHRASDFYIKREEFNEDYRDLVQAYEDDCGRTFTDEVLNLLNPDNLLPEVLRKQNVGKLADVMRFVQKHYPELYDQKHWTGKTGCGTSACQCGWAIVEDGNWYPTVNRQWTTGPAAFDMFEVSLEPFQWNSQYSGEAKNNTTDTYPISAIGGLMLGLSVTDSDVLFDETYQPGGAYNVGTALDAIAEGVEPIDVKYVPDPT